MSDCRRSDREFEVGEEVFPRLRYPHLKSISSGPVSKLSPKYFEPFPIIARVGRVAYRLKLPEESCIHPVFHVSLLKKSAGSQLVSPMLPQLPKEVRRIVESEVILDWRVIYRQGALIIQVLVKWQGAGEEESTWEYLPQLLQQFPRFVNLLSLPWGQERANGGGGNCHASPAPIPYSYCRFNFLALAILLLPLFQYFFVSRKDK